jgi:anti-sigma regulatory factor (Ser/Thr protein kinase)
MAPWATGADSGDAAAGPVMTGSAVVLASLTIPGQPGHVSAARSFVADVIGDDSAADVAVLLASETVTNAVLHSNSRRPGGTVTVTVLGTGGGVRIEVADNGSELSIPVVRGEGCVTGGHGLLLVQTLADQWGYVRDDTGTTVWFWLSAQPRLAAAAELTDWRARGPSAGGRRAADGLAGHPGASPEAAWSGAPGSRRIRTPRAGCAL